MGNETFALKKSKKTNLPHCDCQVGFLFFQRWEAISGGRPAGRFDSFSDPPVRKVTHSYFSAPIGGIVFSVDQITSSRANGQSCRTIVISSDTGNAAVKISI